MKDKYYFDERDYLVKVEKKKKKKIRRKKNG